MSEKEKKRMPVSPRGRVSFESVFVPTAMEEGQEKKYGLTLLLPKSMKGEQLSLYKAMKAAAEALCKEKFGCGLDGKYKGKPIKSPFRDGVEKEHLDGYGSEVIFVRFSGRIKPGVIDQRKHAIASDSGDFYNGCWAHVTFTVYHYTKVNNGIAFGLVNVQKVAEGEPFSAGSSDPDVDFGEVDEDGSGETSDSEETLEDALS